jgi:biopolymer transport protein TolR
VARGGRRSHQKDEHSVADSELNLVPYLDIMVNLIMFMLLTFQVTADLKVINFNPPASGGGGGGGAPADEPLRVTVLVSSEGFQVTTTQDGNGSESVKMKDGDWDYVELKGRLARIQREVPNLDPNLVVVAEPAIVYDTVVKTLDAARLTPDGSDLFPNVTLGLAVE